MISLDENNKLVLTNDNDLNRLYEEYYRASLHVTLDIPKAESHYDNLEENLQENQRNFISVVSAILLVKWFLDPRRSIDQLPSWAPPGASIKDLVSFLHSGLQIMMFGESMFLAVRGIDPDSLEMSLLHTSKRPNDEHKISYLSTKQIGNVIVPSKGLGSARYYFFSEAEDMGQDELVALRTQRAFHLLNGDLEPCQLVLGNVGNDGRLFVMDSDTSVEQELHDRRDQRDIVFCLNSSYSSGIIQDLINRIQEWVNVEKPTVLVSVVFSGGIDASSLNYVT